MRRCQKWNSEFSFGHVSFLATTTTNNIGTSTTTTGNIGAATTTTAKTDNVETVTTTGNIAIVAIGGGIALLLLIVIVILAFTWLKNRSYGKCNADVVGDCC